jgi:hypothetical protein
MTQILYQDNAAAFAHQATAELISFLTSSNAASNINYLSDFLQSFPITTRDTALGEEIGSESPGSYPLVHFNSTTKRIIATNARGIHVEGETDIVVIDSQPKPIDASTRCVAVAGAIASAIKQTMFDENASDWSRFYSGAYPNGIVVNQVTCPGPPVMESEDGLFTGAVRYLMTAHWVHFEALN